MNSEALFTKIMRKETSKIHNISDGLINAKLGFALSNNDVWAEGLLVFYEVFCYLESAMDRLNHTLIGELDIPGMRRVAAFEKDLSFYYGPKWKTTYKPRPSVKNYTNYLEQVEKRDHRLLMAYIYHMYMGLLSGGQILKKKREFLQKVPLSGVSTSLDGLAVVTVSGNVSKLKKQLADSMNNIALQLDDDTKEELILESRRVFELNNEIVSTIETNSVVTFKIIKWLFIVVFLLMLVNSMAKLFK